ncbi:MAG TPA: phosphoribosylanthranilate isomerase [Bryobacteraceae bacterium]|nr:phosphoribosylanthranilate isomerase [Bryobacteraceae bacterium]
MMVKVCGITNAEDALAAVDAGAGALGFVLWAGSPRRLPQDAVARIIGQLPAGVEKVGLYVNEGATAIARSMNELGLDVAQLHGECGMPSGVRVWKSVRIGPAFRPEEVSAGEEEAVVLDTSSPTRYGGTGETFDWAMARGVRHRVILAGGLSQENVAEAIRVARPWGVDASSRLERAPGLKDHGRVRAFIQAALEAASVLK